MKVINPFRRPRWSVAYSFTVVTAALFLLSWIGQFVATMFVLRTETDMHGRTADWGEFFAQFFAATFENWQSEFLQLCWQAAGLALLYHWGSSQSREGDAQINAKLDTLLDRSGGNPHR